MGLALWWDTANGPKPDRGSRCRNAWQGQAANCFCPSGSLSGRAMKTPIRFGFGWATAVERKARTASVPVMTSRRCIGGLWWQQPLFGMDRASLSLVQLIRFGPKPGAALSLSYSGP